MPAGMPLGGARRLQRRHELRSPLCAARRRVILNRTMPTPGTANVLTSVLLPALAIHQWRDAAYGPALVSFAAGVLWLLFGIPFGILADRVSARAALVAAAAGRSATLLLAAVSLKSTLVPVGATLVAAAFLVGSASVLRTVAAQAALPKIVPKDERVSANAWQFRTTSGIELLSLMLGGSLTALSAPVGLATAAAISASAIVPSLMVCAPAAHTRARTEIFAGFRFLLGNALIRQSTMVSAVWRISAGAGSALAIPYLVRGLEVRGALLGLAMGAVGVGVFAGSLALPTLNRRYGSSARLWRTMLCLGAIGSIVRALPLSTFSVLALILGGVMIGVAITSTNILVATQRMNVAPRSMIGQVAAAFSMIVRGAMPLGAVIAAPLLELFDAAAAFAIGSALLLACPLIALLPPLGTMCALDGDCSYRSRPSSETDLGPRCGGDRPWSR